MDGEENRVGVDCCIDASLGGTGLVRAKIEVHELDIGYGTSIVGKSQNWLVFSDQKNKRENLCIIDTNDFDKKPVSLDNSVAYFYASMPYVITFGEDLIFFDPGNVELFSYNTTRRECNWTTQVYKPGEHYLGDWTMPVLKDGKLYLSAGPMMVIDAKSGAIEEPCSDKELSKIRFLDSYINVSNGKHIFSYNFMSGYCYDLELKKYIWRLMYNEFDSYFVSYSRNGTFFWDGYLYVLYTSAYGCPGKLNQLAKVNFQTGKVEQKVEILPAFGAWVHDGHAYIFQDFYSCGDKYILRFNLKDLSSVKILANDIFYPLGIANGKLVYGTKDSVNICDTDGKVLETVLLGTLTRQNCRLFGDTVYYINGSKPKWFDVPAAIDN